MQADVHLDLVNSVRTISQDEWAALSKIERRNMFSKFTIHVVGESEDKILRHIKNWQDLTGFSSSFNLERPLHVHGNVFVLRRINLVLMTLQILLIQFHPVELSMTGFAKQILPHF